MDADLETARFDYVEWQDRLLASKQRPLIARNKVNHTHFLAIYSRGIGAKYMINNGFMGYSGSTKEDKKSIVSTGVGREFHDLLPDFAVKPDLTALWHDKQNQIEQGLMNYQSLVDEVDNVINKEIERATLAGLSIKTDSVACSACKSGFIVPRTKFNKQGFWGCTNYPECKQTFDDNKGNPVLAKKSQAAAKSCQSCEDGSMIRKKGPAGFFWGCSNYPRCRNTLKDKKGKPSKRRS